jgi:hypothetical protein
MVNTISCPALCVFAPLREALPGLYHQSLDGRGVRGEGGIFARGKTPAISCAGVQLAEQAEFGEAVDGILDQQQPFFVLRILFVLFVRFSRRW